MLESLFQSIVHQACDTELNFGNFKQTFYMYRGE